ncbi:MAG: winged helix-turn-helix transcriptional regulator [Ignavibacteriales bacterium]
MNTLTREEWEQLVNDVNQVKASTQSINRIMVIGNSQAIRSDLLNAVGNSVVRAATLVLAGDPITSKDLAVKLGIDARNLTAQIRPLIEKGYIMTRRQGGRTFYLREEKVDLVGFINMPEIKALIRKWEERRGDAEA